jgi:hypothetical protein
MLVAWAGVVAPARADVIPGEYSLGVTGTSVGGQISLDIVVEHDGVNPGNYQGVQWDIDYDQELVSFVDVVASEGSPDQCAFTSDNGDTLLVGCIDLSGDALSLSGAAFTATFTCTGDGTAAFRVLTAQNASFVANQQGNQPSHFHDAEIVCGEPTANAGTAAPSETEASQAQTPGVTSTTANGDSQGQGDDEPAETGADNDDDGDGSNVLWIIVAVVAFVLVAGAGAVYVARTRGQR